MKKLLILLFVGILATTGAWANPINLLQEGTPVQTSEVDENMINQEMLDTLNQNIFIQIMVKDYNSVGIKIEDTFYISNIQDDKIISITKSNDYDSVDYTIETNFAEMLYVFANHNKMSKVELLRTLVMDKDVPVQVVMNLAGVFMRGEY